MDQVRCQIEIPEVKGLEKNEMTVGRHALLACEGDWNKSFDFTKAQFKLEGNQKYFAHVLKAEARSGNSFDVEMTTYVGSQIKFPQLVLSDGTNEINLGPQNLETKSVLPAPQQGQPPPKPYGYLLPLSLHWPQLYFVMLGAVVVLLIAALIYRLQKAARFARLIADLQQYRYSLAPDTQFYKTLRQLEKLNYPLDEMEKAFRLYVLRTFQVPMYALNNRQIIGFFKKRKSVFKIERQQLDRLLSEFEELKNKKEISSEEQSELIHKMYRFVDRTQSIEGGR